LMSYTVEYAKSRKNVCSVALRKFLGLVSD
jgi:hypothetical protein